MDTWLTEMFKPFAGPVGAPPSLRCVAVGAALAGYAAWRQRRSQTASGASTAPVFVPTGDDRAVAGVAGDHR